jgi:hypothetical protein
MAEVAGLVFTDDPFYDAVSSSQYKADVVKLFLASRMWLI